MICKALFLFCLALFLIAPASADTTEHYLGYDIIYHEDGSKTIIEGANNYVRYDGVIEPASLMKKGTIHYPYLIEDNGANWKYSIEGRSVFIPKTFEIQEYPNKISPSLTYSKTTLINNMINYNATVAYLVFPYSLNQVKTWSDDNNIQLGRWLFKAGNNHISIYDSEGTYLSPDFYDFRIVNDEIRLYFVKSEANSLQNEVTFEMHSWNVVDYATSWDGGTSNNVSINQKNLVIGNFSEYFYYIDDTDIDSLSTFSIYETASDYGIIENNYAKINVTTINPRGYESIIFSNNTTNFNFQYIEGAEFSASVNLYFNSTHYILLESKPAQSGTVMYYYRKTGDTNSGWKQLSNTFVNGTWYTVTIQDDTAFSKVYINGVLKYTDAYNHNWDSYTLRLRSDDVSTCYYDTIRNYNYNVLYGERITKIYDSGLDDVLKNVSVNGTFVTGEQTADIYINSSSDNFTWSGWQLVKDDAVSTTVYSIDSQYQKRYYQVKVVLETDDVTKTPILESIRSETGEASVEPPSNTAPSISNPSPTTPKTICNSTNQIFTATINQTANNKWLQDGILKEWDNSTTAPSFTFNESSFDTFNITLIAYNTSNSSLFSSYSWSITTENCTITPGDDSLWGNTQSAISWGISTCSYLVSNIGAFIVTAVEIIAVIIVCLLIGGVFSLARRFFD